MSQHDFEIANQGFPSFRSDLNNALQALASINAGATEPTTTYAYQFWYDETTDLLKMRNGDDDAWITLAYFDQTNDEWEVRSAVIQAVDSAGVVIKTDDGTTRLTIADSGAVSINTSLDVDNIKIDGNTISSTDTNGDISLDPDGTGDVIVESANVGIGTSSPAGKLSVRRLASTGSDNMQLASFVADHVGSTVNDSFGGYISFYHRTGGNLFVEPVRIGVIGRPSNRADLVFYGGGTSGINPTERVRISSGGDVGIGRSPSGGKLDVSTTSTFINFHNPTYGDVGKINATGDNIAFDGTVVSGVAGIGLRSSRWTPRRSQSDADNVVDLGDSSTRFDDLYATNGTIQTSDRNEKQDIEELTEAEQRVAVACKSLMRKFRWKDKVAEKGDDARIHFGIIAQDLQAAFEAEGLDAGRYAMFIHSEWWETQTEVPAVEAQDAVYETVTDEEGNETQVLVSEAVEAKEAYTRTDTYETEEEAPEGAVKKSRMGVRYSELLAFIISAI